MEDLHPFSQLAQLYVYEHPVAHGVVEALAVILMKRDHGCLIALPPGVIPDDELLAGMDVGMEGQVGPNTQVEAPRACFVGGSAEVQDGASLTVTLVDLGRDAVFRLFPLVAGEEPELLSLFDPSTPDIFPDPVSLLESAQAWARGTLVDGDRLAFYSAEEGEVPTLTSPTRPVLRLSRPSGLGATPKATLGTPRGGTAAAANASPPAKAKRPTTANLAAQLETTAQTLPALTARLEDLSARQESYEARLAGGAAATLALPLGPKPKEGAKLSNLAAVLGPFPRTATLPSLLCTESAWQSRRFWSFRAVWRRKWFKESQARVP